MKMGTNEQSTLDVGINTAQHESVLVTRNNKPRNIGQWQDDEQWPLENSNKFWKLINERRKQKTISRAQLEQKLNNINN